jgi:DNA-binding transcriptional LysR family regulator
MERLDALLQVSKHESILAATGNDKVKANLMGRQIRELRAALGVPLTRKEGRLLALNEQGVELASIVSNFFDAIEAFKDTSASNSATYVIGTGSSIISNALIPNFKKIRELSNGAKVIFKNRKSSEIIKLIQMGELDIGILSRQHCEGKKIETFSLRTIGYSLFVPKVFADQVPKKSPFKALAAIPFATLEGEGELKGLLQQIALRNKIELNPVFQGTSLVQVAQVIQAGECCGILPDFFETGFEDDEIIKFSLSALKKLRREYLVAWKKETELFKHRIKTDAVETIRQVFRDL